MGKKQKQKQRVVLPPQLPPDISDEDIEVSDEDLQFVAQNKDYAGFVSSMDTQSITKHVNRVANANEDTLEALYEKRVNKNFLERQNEERKLQVDPVDALPIKTLDGQLEYRTAPKKLTETESASNEADEDGGGDMSLVKRTKPERRAILKKSKKEAKKQMMELATTEEIQQTPQAEVLAEIQKDLNAEEVNDNKKNRLAELGDMMLANPESNIKSLKEMLQIFKDGDHHIIKLGMLSLVAVFRDIIPGYRIRLPTEKELEMVVSKEVKKRRYYESTLLTSYKTYLQKLMVIEQQPALKRIAIQCFCTLLDAVPHFNFRDNLLGSVVKNINSSDDAIRKRCCTALQSLFTYEGKHGGEATVEAVRLIAGLVKARNCQLHPDSIEVFLSLSFNEDLRRPDVNKDKFKKKKSYRKINPKESSQVQGNDKKKNKHELKAKTRDEVDADFKAAAYAPDVMEQRKIQSETLSSVFQTYFRILKHTMQLISASSQPNDKSPPGVSGAHPLLDPCLNGLGKFAHLIDLDFMSTLMSYLKILASGSDPSDKILNKLTVTERLRCCIVTFKVMRNNLDALNVDLQDFFVQLYNLILEYRPVRDQGAVLAEALKIMLCDDRQHDMQKAAAFIKRLATFSLCFGAAESMAALVTLKHLLQKNLKCRNLLENDAGGGSVSGSIAKYQPYATDPNLSGALASVLWELNLLSKHYHPSVQAMASSISSINTENQVYLALQSPQQAFNDLSLERDSDMPKNFSTKVNNHNKRKRGVPSVLASTGVSPDVTNSDDEDRIREKLSKHFVLLRDIELSAKLRGELDLTSLSLNLYEKYKNEKKKKYASKFRKVK